MTAMQNTRKLSPIPVQQITRLRRFNDARLSRDGETLFWVESVDNRGMLFQYGQDGQANLLSAELDVRGTVGYGGGELDVGTDSLVFCERNGGLYRLDLHPPHPPQVILPPFNRVAAPTLSPDEQWVLVVFQQGETDGLALVRSHGFTWPAQLVMGADFYMQPTWHPGGKMIAWTEWDHPHMPWQASRVKLAKVTGMQLRLVEERWIDGQDGAAASQPIFSPNGRWMSYIRRQDEWDCLILYDLKKRIKRTLLQNIGCHLTLPAWVQGLRSTCWSADSRFIYHLRYLRGQSSLWRLDVRTGRSQPVDIHPLTWVTQLDGQAGQLALLAQTPDQPKGIWQLGEGQPQAVVQSEGWQPPPAGVTRPQEIAFLSDGVEVYANYFPPCPAASADNMLPPLIIDIHSGPTSQDALAFSSEAAFYNSRGYAFAQVNYRGSSGFGYNYQEALRERWGEVDVADCVACARELVGRGLADPRKLVIKGSSAGGFTALNALIRQPGFFRAAICSYPVVNLIDDARNTHKFERYYHRFLTGDLQKDYERFEQRSPLFQADKILDPVALFHGENDQVVSPEQSRQIHALLQARGLECTLTVYPDEGHGFRKLDTIQDYYRQVEAFLKTRFK